MSVQKSNILIVDDTRIYQSILADFVDTLGHESVVANDGNCALELLDGGHHPDLILLDLTMPNMDGLTLLSRLKNDPRRAGVPVIMLSGNEAIEKVVECIRIGADDYLTKPFNPTLLEARINHCLERSQALSQVKKLGQYTLHRQIGTGGMAEVYVARHAMLRRPTAVKLLKPRKVNEQILDYFEQEVQLTSQLSHPNTIVVYDYGRTPEGIFYYAMEYLPGLNLKELVERFGALPEARVIYILAQVVSSLEEAHECGLIHRDIKPANVMICKRGGIFGFAKLLDFGIVKNIDENNPFEAPSTGSELAGTPPYMSPESIITPDCVDELSDIYSLGALAYFLVTGTNVFEEKSAYETFQAHLSNTPEAPSKRCSNRISADFESVILHCLEKQPERRPQSTTELLIALDRCDHADAWTQDEARRRWLIEASEDAEDLVELTGTSTRHPARTMAIDVADRMETQH